MYGGEEIHERGRLFGLEIVVRESDGLEICEELRCQGQIRQSNDGILLLQPYWPV